MTTQEKYAYMRQGYTADQVEEIKLGLEEGLDVDVYVKKEFFALQMREIRLGLINDLPVEIYAKKEYDWFQMEEIRLGLEAGLDVSVYTYPLIPYDTMRQLRLALADGINLRKYLNLPSGVLKELRKSFVSQVNISPYIDQGYDKEQLEQIRLALEKNLNIKPYLKLEYRGISLREIRIGLERNVDVSVYANLDYNWRQMREIRKGMEHQIEYSLYMNPLYDWRQMREIRFGLEAGLDITKYCSLMYPATDMAVRRLNLAYGNSGDTEIHKAGHTEISYDNFDIQISADEMEAYIKFNGRAIGLTKSVIFDALEDRGISAGIQNEAIEKILAGITDNEPILIAKGRQPEKGKDGYYEYFFRTEVKHEPKVLEDGSLDYQDIEWFEQVKRGQKLAVYHDCEVGNDGYNVFGLPVPGIKGNQLNILVGQGFYIEPDKHTYVANIDGVITLEDSTMIIMNMLTLSEVTTSLGDVNFDGSIHVTGNVGNGCSIVARDDIIIDGFVEGANIEAGGSIFLRHGVNAHSNGQISAQKDVEGSFFENAKIYAGGNIAMNYCFNSNISCEGSIEVSGRKNSIVGGVTFAAKEIRVHQVGNSAGLRTFLKLGVNTEMLRRQSTLTKQIDDIDKELQVLEQAFADYREKYPTEDIAKMDIFKKIENAMFTKEEMKKRLLPEKIEIDDKVMQAQNARAIITGNVCKGVVVEICGRSWFSDGARDVTICKNNDKVELITNRA